MNITIDIEKLRNDLIDLYGTAMQSNPVAMMDLIKIEKASDEEVARIAMQNGINIEIYIIDSEERSNYGKRKM